MKNGCPHRKKTYLCKITDLSLTDCKQFNFTDENGSLIEGFLVKSGEKISGYINACPHLGVALNWQPDSFLDLDQKYIICALHGALFQPENGLCVHGPCYRQKLKPLPVEQMDGVVFLIHSRP